MSSPSSAQSAMLSATLSSVNKRLYWLHSQWLLRPDVELEIWKKAWLRVCSEVALLRLVFDPVSYRFLMMDPASIEVVLLTAESLEGFLQLARDRCETDLHNSAWMDNGQLRLVRAVAYCWSGVGQVYWTWSCHHSMVDGGAFTECIKVLADTYRSIASDSSSLPACFHSDPSESHFQWQEKLQHADLGVCRSHFSKIRSESEVQGNLLDSIRSIPPCDERSPNHRRTIELAGFPNSSAAKMGLPLSAWIHAATGLVLRRILGNRSVAFATTRHLRKNELMPIPSGALGLFANTLPFVIHHNDSITVFEHVRRIRRDWTDTRPFEHCAYSEALGALGADAGKLTIDWIVDIARKSREMEIAGYLDGLIEGTPVFEQTTDFPLALSVTLEPVPRLVLIADSKRITKQFAQDLAEMWGGVFEDLVSNPHAALGTIYQQMKIARSSLVSTKSSSSISEDPPASRANVVQRLAVIVADSPEWIAISDPERSWSYQQLWEASDRIAKMILRRCPAEQDIVPIIGNRSIETIASIWGVLRSGKAFLILSEDTPIHLRQSVLDSLSSYFGATPWQLEVRTDAFANRDEVFGTSPSLYDDIQLPAIDDHGLAYLVTTSGTTGVPKLVMIEHQGLEYLVSGYQQVAKLTHEDCRYQGAAITSDTFILEVMLYLTQGCRLWIEPDLLSQGFEALNYRIGTIPITVLGMPSSVWKEWAAYCMNNPALEAKRLAKLRMVICSMERTDAELLARWRATPLGKKIWINAYGPSETSCVATILRLDPDSPTPTGNIPIGNCLHNANIRIWNTDSLEVPPGVLGEIVIGGKGVGRGYLGNTQVSESRFIKSCLEPIEDNRSMEQRLYRTGDLGYVDELERVVFVGRRDAQIKIRGHRIELEEVETHLRMVDPKVEDAAVLAVPAGSSLELVAFYCSPSELQIAQWINYLGQRLIPVAIPRRFFRVQEIPRSPVGKVDRHKLLEIHNARNTSDSAESKTARLDQQDSMFCGYLSRLISETFPMATWQPGQGFLDLGGDSLIAMTLLARIERDTSIRIPPSFLLGNMPLESIGSLWTELPKDMVHVVPLTNGPGNPVFWMPNLSGDASAIPSWVSHWQGKRPVIAVGLSPAAYYAQGLTIEQLGESIASKILSSNPESPVHLLGLSFGGKLAWEVALRLNRSGQQVGQVVIGDASARSGDAPNVIAQSARIIVHFPKWLQNELRKKDRNSLSILRSWRLLRKLVAGLTRRVQLSIKSQEKDSARQVAKHFDLQNRSEVQRHFMASAWNAAASYRPCPAPISLFLIRCRIRPLLGDYSEDLGWRAVVEGSFVAEDVDIDHEALFNSNHTMRIVSRIESELAVFDRSQRRINFGKVETLELD